MHTLTALTKTCIAFPAQWTGQTADGLTVAIRYRGGLLECAVDNHLVYENRIGDQYDGCMENHELRTYLDGVLTFADGLQADYPTILGGRFDDWELGFSTHSEE